MSILLVACGGGSVADYSKPAAFNNPSNGDGLAGAPAGTPQYPNLLSAYAIRPTWNVAGVDYAVGVPAGLVLKDPTIDSLPSGCSYNGGTTTVNCSGNNITLQGYDFTLHSTSLYFGSGSDHIVVTRNKFGGTACVDPMILMQGVANSTLSYNTLDGGGATCTTLPWGTVISMTVVNGSTIIREYNWLKNAPADMTQNAGPTSGSATIIDRFNLYDTQGWSGHPDGIQLNGGNFSNSFYSYNTYRNPNVGQGAAAGTQPVHIEAQLTATISNYTVNNNVVLTSGTGWQTANIDIACKQSSGINTNTGFSAYANYIDATGTVNGSAALSNGYSCTGTTWGSPTPNYNIVTGVVIPTP